MATRSERVFVGVDAGGTRTRAVCVDEAGRVLGRGTAGPANHASGGVERARDAVVAAIVRAMEPLGPAAAIDTTFIASAGLEHAGGDDDGRELLDARVTSRRVLLDTDAYAAWAGAFRCRPGIVVIAGTGSMALGVDAEGRRAKVGGWGWRVGDGGSAYAIAVSAMRDALRYVDGDGEASRLFAALRRFVSGRAAGGGGGRVGAAGGAGGESDDRSARAAASIRTWLYDARRTPGDIAAFAPAVELAAQEGCPIARTILVGAGEELASLVEVVVARLDGADLPVALSGSVLLRNEEVRASFEARLRGLTVAPTITRAAYPPDLGAALLALGARQDLPAEVRANLDAAAAPAQVGT